ncbi:MAG: hypothetical protein Q4F15_05145 [Bacillota bacterium]|nr:hypothetical protein [Bacillota bacterium]
MAQSKKGKLNYRCPQCFMRDLDIDMFFDEEKNEYYCIRCCFHGDEKKVLEWNELIKLKYGHISDRIDKMGKDNEPIKWKVYKKGSL